MYRALAQSDCKRPIARDWRNSKPGQWGNRPGRYANVYDGRMGRPIKEQVNCGICRGVGRNSDFSDPSAQAIEKLC
jgi:hypothetical protein